MYDVIVLLLYLGTKYSGFDPNSLQLKVECTGQGQQQKIDITVVMKLCCNLHTPSLTANTAMLAACCRSLMSRSLVAQLHGLCKCV